VFDLFEFEAVPVKQNLNNIQHLWQQIRIAHNLCSAYSVQQIKNSLLNQYSREKTAKKGKPR